MTGQPSIVVGCDGRPTSDGAVRFAAEEARLREARLVVVCAYYRSVDPDLTDFDLPDATLQERAVTRATLSVRRALGSQAPVTIDFVAAEGDPARVLEAHAGD